MGQTLFDLLNGKNLVLYADDELRQQALSTVSIETPRAGGLPKRSHPRRLTPLSPWRWRVLRRWRIGGEIGNRAARGFNRSAHVAKEKLVPVSGAVYIGQTLIDVPATLIAQEDRGAIYVLAAFATEDASLRKHLETIVKPWLLPNARCVFQNRRLVLGTCEDLTDRQATTALRYRRGHPPGVRRSRGPLL